VARKAQRPPHNLPAELTSFVGRRGELAEIKRLLSGSRLITLTGTGGVGKTRLALRTGADVLRAFPDGVWLIELAALQEEALLAQAVANALGLQDQAGGWVVLSLSKYLAGKRMLLLLDNCEHLLNASAVLGETLLHSCPELRILATSRQALGVAGESTLRVPSLSVPEGPVPSADALVQYEAVRMLVDRATAAEFGFALTEHNHVAIAQLCQRLDGIPLAIELAAVRLKALTPDQILERLDDRFRLLTTGSRTSLQRQQTLKATIDWSFELLSVKERALWRKLSVFAGSFELEAAKFICAGEGVSSETVSDLVWQLLDKSILVRERDGSPRYRLIETLRQYGLEKLVDANEEGALRRRHSDWFGQLATSAEAGLWGPGQVDWIDRLQADHANLRAALDSCLAEPGEADRGVAMAAALWLFWHARGHLSEGRRWLDLALAAQPRPTPARARGLAAAGYLALNQNDLAAAADRLEESRMLALQLGVDATLAFALQWMGLVALFQGDATRAEALIEESLARHRTARYPMGAAMALLEYATLMSFRGETKRAIALHEETIGLCQAQGDSWVLAWALFSLGLEILREGDLPRATDLEKESLRRHLVLDHWFGAASCIEALAWLAGSQGRAARAATLLGAAEALRQSIPAPLAEVWKALHAACESACRTGLVVGGFERAYGAGLKMDRHEAAGYALEERPVQPKPKPETPVSPLSRREREIAALIASGLSNKQIASRLVIAQRTAEAHVEHILNKLGYSSRAQVAAWAADQLGSKAESEHLAPRD